MCPLSGIQQQNSCPQSLQIERADAKQRVLLSKLRGILSGIPILNKIVKENLAFEQRPEERWRPERPLGPSGADMQAAGPARVALPEFTAVQAQRAPARAKLLRVKTLSMQNLAGRY